MEPAVNSARAGGVPNTKNLVDTRNYVLHYGLKEKRLRKMQTEAYLNMQQKIATRGDAARALVLSANLLGISVMSSQLSMYRWKVSEAQSMTQATSRLQEEVMDALKKGYQVRRTNTKVRRGKSKYADKKALQKLFTIKMEQIQRRKERREKRKEAAAAAGEDLAMAMKDVMDSESVSLSDISSDESSIPSGNSSTCSVEKLKEGSEGGADGRNRNVSPPDMVSSVVIVDSFTHEPYEDIIEHLRYIDKRYDLNLVIILLLPKNDDARDLQGAGHVLTPDHQFTMEDAYSRGYDLVLTHFFDHVVVEFLTDTFVSSSGRWRNDVRAKAAVGNYISLKNILMGRIDMNVLKQLAWDEEVDDAGLLDVIGQHSLALHGENKRIGIAGATLSKGRVGVTTGGVADFDGTDGSGGSNDPAMALPTNLSRYRTRQMNVHGVNVKKDVFTALEDITGSNAGEEKDMLGKMMAPSDATAQHTVRRRRKNADPEDESEDAYEYVLVTVEEQNKNIINNAFENELTRLIAENDKKTKTINILTEDVERLTKTVTTLKKSGGMEESKFKDTERDPFTGSLMNLSKEQQIYILKERLDMANDQIATLMEDGNQRRSRSTGSNQGTPSPWGAATGGEKSGNNSGRINKKLQARNRRMYRSYNERRECDLLRMHDYDAAQLPMVRGGSASHTSQSRMQRSRREHHAGESPNSRRRRHEQTDKVMMGLQKSLENPGASPADAGNTMKSALELLTLQQQRLNQLEETVKRNAQLLDEAQDALKTAHSRGSVGGGGGDIAGGTKKGKKGKGTSGKSVASSSSSDARKPSLAMDSGEGARKRRSLGARRKSQIQHSTFDEEAITAAIREEVEHEAQVKLQKTVENLERKHRVQLRKRGGVAKKILQKLYLKIQKPYTKEYLSELHTQRQQTLEKGRGLKQRLLYLVNSLGPNEVLSEREQEETNRGGFLSRLKDSEKGREITRVARECALHSVKASQISAEIKEVEDKINTPEGQNEFLTALNNWEKRKACTREVGTTLPDTENYLNTLAEELAAEERVMKWGTPSVLGVIENGLERKDDPHNGISFHKESIPKVMKNAGGEWLLRTPQEGASDDALIQELNDVALQEDPILGDMHQVFVAITNPEIEEVLAASPGGGSSAHSSKHRSRRPGSSSRGRSGGAGAGAGGGRAEDSGDGETSSSDDEDRPHHSHHHHTDGTFLTGTDIEEAEGHDGPSHSLSRHSTGGRGKPPLAERVPGSGSISPRRPSSMKDLLARISLSRAGGSSTGSKGEYHIDRILSAGLGSSNRSSSESFAPFSEHPGVVDELIKRDAGKAKIDLYNSALNSYRSGYVHPDRMLDVERSAQSPELVERELADHYLAHHQELLRLLQLLALRTPALGVVLEQHTEELEAKLTEDLHRSGANDSQEGENRNGVTVPFLLAYDTAAITWYVDYLCHTMPEHKTALGVMAASTGGPPVDDLRPNRFLRNLEPNDERLQLYEDVVTVLTQPYGLASLGDEAWASPVVCHENASTTSPRQPREELDSAGFKRNSRSIINNQGIKVQERPRSGANRGRGGSAHSGHKEEREHDDMNQLPDRLAALFSDELNRDNAMTAAEIYLENETEEEEEDENLQLMRDIQLELAYLRQLREERLAELRLRYKYRQKQLVMREKSKYEGWEQEKEEPAEQEVPDFEVKGGSAAWYGMEAAKRVKDILKRRHRPDQIILGSGGVGVELSKRTAFPRPKPKELNVMQSIEERMRAAHRALPPLRRRGLSRWQQQFYKGLPEPDDLGYIDPREEAVVNAFGRMARINHQHDNRSLPHPLSVPPALSERVISFRQSLQKMGVRGPRGSVGEVEKELGDPFFLPVGAHPIPSTTDLAEMSEEIRSKSMARLDLTSWVYGVPSNELQAAFEKPLHTDQNEDSKMGVVFLPSGRVVPNRAAQLNRTASAGMSLQDGNRAGGRRVLPNQNSIYNPYRALGPDQFVTPSALAAQRLSLMLRASASDPAITGRGNNFATIVSPVRSQRWWRNSTSYDSIPLPGSSSVEQGPVDSIQGRPAPFTTRSQRMSVSQGNIVTSQPGSPRKGGAHKQVEKVVSVPPSPIVGQSSSFRVEAINSLSASEKPLPDNFDCTMVPPASEYSTTPAGDLASTHPLPSPTNDDDDTDTGEPAPDT